MSEGPGDFDEARRVAQQILEDTAEIVVLCVVLALAVMIGAVIWEAL